MAPPSPPAPRRFGRVNWRGVWSLYRRDVVRFLRYAGESLGGPAVSSLMFLAVFDLALDGRAEMAPGVPLTQFIVPGIVVFAMVHAAFENAAIPIIYDKHEGMIGDILGAPLSAREIVTGYTLSATTNGLTAALAVMALLSLFVGAQVHAPLIAIGFAAAGALLFALGGFVTGVWADRWDNYSAVETFAILPLGLLSGAFFSVAKMPAEARWAIEANPVRHVVNGLRYGLTGHSDGSLVLGASLLAALIGLLAVLAWRLVASGYKIKA